MHFFSLVRHQNKRATIQSYSINKKKKKDNSTLLYLNFNTSDCRKIVLLVKTKKYNNELDMIVYMHKFL